jgi:hypothetical protein
MSNDLEKIKPIYVRLGKIAQQLGISKRSLERFISERNGNIPGRYQMPDRKSFIYNAAEIITYFNSQLITPNQLTKPVDLFKHQRSVKLLGHKPIDLAKHYVGL